jgi:hypothetical protein
MADSTTNEEIIEMFEDRIQTKETGKITIRDAQFLLLIEIRDLLTDIKANTTPS